MPVVDICLRVVAVTHCFVMTVWLLVRLLIRECNMKHHYVLRLYDLSDNETAHEFICTKSQMDKVFFALAFASCNSTIKRCSLYLMLEAPHGVTVSSPEQLVNTFECKGGFSHVSKVR